MCRMGVPIPPQIPCFFFFLVVSGMFFLRLHYDVGRAIIAQLS